MDEPITREEQFLAAIAGEAVNVPTPSAWVEVECMAVDEEPLCE